MHEYLNQLVLIPNDQKNSPVAAIILTATHDLLGNDDATARLSFVTRKKNDSQWAAYPRGKVDDLLLDPIKRMKGIKQGDQVTIVDVPGPKDSVFMKGGRFDSEISDLGGQFKLGDQCVRGLHEMAQVMHAALQRSDGRLTADDITASSVARDSLSR